MSCESVLKVHRVRFLIAEITSINCMCFDEEMLKLAVIRRRIRKYKANQSESQSVVQIWNYSTNCPFVEQTIFDDFNNPSLIESLIWAPKGRLFSCGLNSNINEYDLKTNRIKKCCGGEGGPVWCMALDTTKTLIAIGTENGFICVYNIENDLEFNKVMDRNENRILCIDWYKPEDTNLKGSQSQESQLIITGSIDYIKIWSYQTGRCVDHIQVGNNGLIIWCIKVLTDFTIISGDSKGTTSFWNGNTSALLNSYGNHRADVLSICVNREQNTVYSSGIDPDIVQFKRTVNKIDEWLTSTTLRIHTHDVRALTYVSPNWLISGGIDSYLTQTCYPPNLQIRHLTNYSSNVTIINDYVLLQFETYLQIWKLGKSEDDIIESEDKLQILPLSECASKLANIKSQKPIITASFNKFWLIYSNSDNIKIKKWSETGIKKIPLLYESIVGCNQITFCGLNFVALVSGNVINVLKLDIMGAILQIRLEFDHRIHSVTSSDKYLVVALSDPKNTIKIYTTKDWNLYCDFVNKSLTTCLQINDLSADGDLWIAFSDKTLLNYKIENKKYFQTIKIKDWISEDIRKDVDEFSSIKQICFVSNALLFSDDNILYKLDQKSKQITKCDKYQHIIKLGNTNTNTGSLNEVVIVEITPDMFFTFLPKTLAKKKFGI